MLFKEARADLLKGFDVASNSSPSYDIFLKVFLTILFSRILEGVKPVWRAGVDE